MSGSNWLTLIAWAYQEGQAMELRWLAAFRAVAEELNFRRAAEKLFVAQPAVSQQIMSLERELGVRLFERTKRSVRLTDAGAAFLEPCRQVLSGIESAGRLARNAGNRGIRHHPDRV